MKDNVLTIQRVLSDGAIAKSITCRGGRIAVLRGHAPEKLYEYELALTGQLEDPRMFRIAFNGNEYQAKDHLFIGFQQIRFAAEAPVGEALLQSGVPKDEFEWIVKSHGFDQLKSTPLAQLTPEEAHCFLLLRSSYKPYPLIVYNDPFLPVPEQYRENYAQTISDGVWRNGTVGICVSLSWRPNNWIDNDLITRVQIDQIARRATVGIGAENPLTELAKQLRKEKEAAQEKVREQEEGERRKSSSIQVIQSRISEVIPISTAQSEILKAKLGSPSIKFFFLGIALLFGGWLAFGDLLLQLTTSPERISSTLNQSSNSRSTTSESPSQFLLDTYDQDIKESVLAAFSGEITEVEAEPVTTPVPATRGEVQQNSPFTRNIPQPPPRPPTFSPPSGFPPPPPPPSGDLPEAFRERMERLMEGKDPAVRERIEMMMERMREKSALGF